MQIKFNDLLRQYKLLVPDLEDRILSSMRSGWWIMGKQVGSFAASFGAYLGVDHVLPVANGTDALELCLRAVGCGPGAEVITVANAGGYTTTACRLVGATPVYIDVDERELLMNLHELPAMLSDKVVAVVATHLYGNIVDIRELRRALGSSGREDVKIIEDCAQAHGARLHGQMAGSLGDIAAFSFYPTKNLGALGDGGAVATNDPMLAAKVEKLRQYGWVRKYKVDEPYGRNSRMDELQAAALDMKLSGLDANNECRREIIGRYASALPSSGGYRFVWRDDESCVGHLAVLLCPDRQQIIKTLEDAGVSTTIHYPILDTDQPGWMSLPQRAADLTSSRRATERILSLPCYPELTEQEIDYICEVLAALPDMAGVDG